MKQNYQATDANPSPATHEKVIIGTNCYKLLEQRIKKAESKLAKARRALVSAIYANQDNLECDAVVEARATTLSALSFLDSLLSLHSHRRTSNELRRAKGVEGI